MKKFEAPELQELNINETSYWYQGWYNHGHGGHGNNGGHGSNDGCSNGKPGTGSDGDNFFDSLS